MKSASVQQPGGVAQTTSKISENLPFSMRSYSMLHRCVRIPAIASPMLKKQGCLRWSSACEEDSLQWPDGHHYAGQLPQAAASALEASA